MKITASALERIALCPGSYFAEKGLRSEQHPSAAEGELLHRAMAKQVALNELNREQGRLVRLCTELGRELKQRLFGDDPGVVHLERFISCRFRAGTISTKLDYISVHGNRALVIDWKFGYGAVEPSEVNLQLRAYSLAVSHEWPGITEVHVAIIQPYADREHRVSCCVYDAADLLLATGEMDTILQHLVTVEAGQFGTAARNPGEAQCKYCKALGTERCPESMATAKTLTAISPGAIMPTGEALSMWLDRCAVVKKVVEVVEKHAKAELEAGREVPGWKLRPGNNVRTLPDAEEAWNVMSDTMTPAGFMTVRRCLNSWRQYDGTYFTLRQVDRRSADVGVAGAVHHPARGGSCDVRSAPPRGPVAVCGFTRLLRIYGAPAGTVATDALPRAVGHADLLHRHHQRDGADGVPTMTPEQRQRYTETQRAARARRRAKPKPVKLDALDRKALPSLEAMREARRNDPPVWRTITGCWA